MHTRERVRDTERDLAYHISACHWREGRHQGTGRVRVGERSPSLKPAPETSQSRGIVARSHIHSAEENDFY